MIDFYEFIVRRQKPTLPDPATLLAKLGITPDVPHEIDVMRMVKQMKKQAAVTPSRRSGPGLSSPTRPGSGVG